jgi:CRP-like cAMP-binding protein
VLAALPQGDYRRLARALEPVNLVFGKVLCEAGATIRHIYFPLDSMISLLAAVGNGDALEVGLVGKEGVVGTPLALGSPTSPVQELVQGAGKALRIPAKRFVAELARSPNLRRLVDRCIHLHMSTAMQIAACNKSHLLEARLARWLLMVRDRLETETIFLTQDFLARMLGVRRAGVNETAGLLQRRSLISYSRGRIRILDLKGLTGVACPCYATIRKLEKRAS